MGHQVFLKHDDLEVPPANSIVWRYMSLEKFLDLLTHKRLFFTNANKLTDRHELTLPRSWVDAKKKELKEKGIAGRELDESLAAVSWRYDSMADYTLVNCWSLGRGENYALWKIYLGGSRAGVAIRTSISSLRKAIQHGESSHPEDIYIGKVRYTDYIPEPEPSRFRLVTTKRTFYKYEEELRLFILHQPQSEGGDFLPYDPKIGRHVTVNTDRLIEKLYLSPFMPSWFGDSIRQVLRKVAPTLRTRLMTSDIKDS